MLVDRAFRSRRDAAAAFDDADLPVMMAGTGNLNLDAGLRGVHLG